MQGKCLTCSSVFPALVVSLLFHSFLPEPLCWPWIKSFSILLSSMKYLLSWSHSLQIKLGHFWPLFLIMKIVMFSLKPSKGSFSYSELRIKYLHGIALNVGSASLSLPCYFSPGDISCKSQIYVHLTCSSTRIVNTTLVCQVNSYAYFNSCTYFILSFSVMLLIPPGWNKVLSLWGPLWTLSFVSMAIYISSFHNS